MQNPPENINFIQHGLNITEKTVMQNDKGV